MQWTVRRRSQGFRSSPRTSTSTSRASPPPTPAGSLRTHPCGPSTACWSRAGARRGWSSPDAPTRRNSPPNSCASRSSTARPAIPGTGHVLRAGRAAAPRPRWHRGSSRWRTPRIPAGRSGCRPAAAESSDSSLRAASSPSGPSSARWWAGSTATTRSPRRCAIRPPCSMPPPDRKSANRLPTSSRPARSSARSTNPSVRCGSVWSRNPRAGRLPPERSPPSWKRLRLC